MVLADHPNRVLTRRIYLVLVLPCGTLVDLYFQHLHSKRYIYFRVTQYTTFGNTKRAKSDSGWSVSRQHWYLRPKSVFFPQAGGEITRPYPLVEEYDEYKIELT